MGTISKVGADTYIGDGCWMMGKEAALYGGGTMMEADALCEGGNVVGKEGPWLWRPQTNGFGTWGSHGGLSVKSRMAFQNERCFKEVFLHRMKQKIRRKSAMTQKTIKNPAPKSSIPVYFEKVESRRLLVNCYSLIYLISYLLSLIHI